MTMRNWPQSENQMLMKTKNRKQIEVLATAIFLRWDAHKGTYYGEMESLRAALDAKPSDPATPPAFEMKAGNVGVRP